MKCLSHVMLILLYAGPNEMFISHVMLILLYAGPNEMFISHVMLILLYAGPNEMFISHVMLILLYAGPNEMFISHVMLIHIFFFISNRTFVFVEKLLKSFAKFSRKVAYRLLNLILKIIRFYRPKLY